VKHKFLRWNEISRRYVDDDPEFYVPEIWRGRSADKKQGSEGVVDVSDLNHHGEDFNGDFGEWTLQERLYGKASDDLELYDILIKAGVAPEQARGILPQSTLTEWYWSGSLDAFAAMCRLRCAPDSQYESRIVADQISKVLGELFPVSWSALMESDA
jgi:thymidylate synthase (FAD)